MLFVSGVDEGGSYMSTLRLARALVERGHRVELIHPRSGGAWATYVLRRADNLDVKLAGRFAHGAVRRITRLLGRRSHGVDDTFPVGEAHRVENAARRRVRARPDVVVVSSIGPVAWSRLHADAAAAGVPIVLYVRETEMIRRLGQGPAPDAVIANSAAHEPAVNELGFTCAVVPSIVSTAESLVESTRRTVLVVSPTEPYGVRRALDVAAALADLPFVLQESLRLTREERQGLAATAGRLPNVEIRPFTGDARQIYRDARLLLAPYTETLKWNRPRVVLEAQANGIPVIAAAWPGLREAVGDGGLLIEPDSGVEAWVRAVRSIWAVPRYQDLVEAALRHASRPAVQSDVIVSQFEAAVEGLLSSRHP